MWVDQLIDLGGFLADYDTVAEIQAVSSRPIPGSDAATRLSVHLPSGDMIAEGDTATTVSCDC
jgi:hypothetical protein